MTKYENMKGLFTFMKFKHNPKKSKNDSFGWEMVFFCVTL
jgi:hypothetical protein